MTEKRNLVLAIVVILAPIVVAWYELSVAAAVGVVLLLLLCRWLITLSGLVAPEKRPDLVLATISASHFVEKVRWCFDRLGVEYEERVSGGTLGAFFRGRTVPQLKAKTGHVVSTIGNSSDILRYVYGRYVATDPQGAAFLEPTPRSLLADGRKSILGGDTLNYTDLSFAALTGLWLMPEAYGGGKADAVRIDRDKAPPAMRADIERWAEAYPHAVSQVEAWYEER